ncbi:MAG: hypothetical protein ABI039_11235 [Vicinamibacterales bacterium]
MPSIPIRYRRAERGVFFQKLQHALPSFVVLGDGLEHLSHDPHGVELALGVSEVVAAVLVMVSVMRGVLHLKRRMTAPPDDHEQAHHGVDWIDIFIGAMLGVEAYAKYHATAHIPRPTILLAVVMLTIGITHGRIAAWGGRKRELRVGPEGISVPGRPFRRLTLAWPEVASIEMDDRAAVITATDGRSRRIDVSDVLQPKAVREALITARTFLDDARHAASASIESTTTDA